LCFYDFETQQNIHIKDDNKTRVHVPNLCVVQQVCTYCLDDNDMTKLCRYYGTCEYVFDQDSVKQLVDLATKPLHLFTLRYVSHIYTIMTIYQPNIH